MVMVAAGTLLRTQGFMQHFNLVRH